MLQGLFSIFDKKAGSYSPPFAFPTRGAALRFFIDLAGDGQSTVCKHPEDFSMLVVGDFNPDTGEVCDVKHEVIGEAVTLKEANA